MKSFHFNIQAKGGTGKSMLTYLQALKHEKDNTIAFVDLDSATHTSSQQLKFIAEKERLFEVDIFDHLKKIERENLFQILEDLSESGFEKFYVDFGSSESEQLLRLLSIDFSVEQFKDFERHLDAKFSFNVVISGGAAYTACFNFLKRAVEMLNGRFEVNVLPNEFTFHQHKNLIEELALFAKSTKGLIKAVMPFGDIFPERQSGSLITENVKSGKGMDAYNLFISKIIIRREIAKV